MLKRIIPLIFLCAGFCATVASALDIPYVDVEVATAKIKEMEEANRVYSDEDQRMIAENQQMSADIDKHVRQINKIDPILQKVDKMGKDLNEAFGKIVDQATKDKAKDAIQRNTALKAKLQEEIKKSSFAKDELEKKIIENKKLIEINEIKIRKNNDEISLLKSSIEKTRNQIQLMKAYIEEVDSFLTEAESVLQSN